MLNDIKLKLNHEINSTSLSRESCAVSMAFTVEQCGLVLTFYAYKRYSCCRAVFISTAFHAAEGSEMPSGCGCVPLPNDRGWDTWYHSSKALADNIFFGLSIDRESIWHFAIY
jgi:hypothetical protein